MYRKIIFIGLVLAAITAKAHQAEVSTIMLVEKENGRWVLQISSSLTAFQDEIRTHFTETPYETPKEFQQMVLEHLKNNLHFIFNGNTEVTLINGIVKLGHETKVVFEVIGIPTELNAVVVQNTAFKDIHRNQSALILLKEGFKPEQFVLNSANDHKLTLKVYENEFVESNKNEIGFFSSGILLILLGGVLSIFLVMTTLSYKKKSVEGVH